MNAPLNQDELFSLVLELEEQNAYIGEEVLKKLSSLEGRKKRETIEHYYDRLDLDSSRRGRDRERAFPIDQRGTCAFVEIMEHHPAFAKERPLRVGWNVFGSEGSQDELLNLRQDAGTLLVAGAIALGQTGLIDERHLDVLMQIAVGADMLDTLLRQILLAKPDPTDYQPVDYKKLIENLLDLYHSTCVAGILSSIAEVAPQINRWTEKQSKIKYRTWATGIKKLVPNTGYGCSLVKIQGLDLGGPGQPPGRAVYFPQAGGGCMEADVVSWEPTEIAVIVPDGVGDGYVGFIEVNQPDEPADDSKFPNLGVLAGELQSCLGLGIGAAIQGMNGIVFKIEKPDCPKALPDDANHFYGGPEIISISPKQARRGDTVMVTGHLFEPDDVVLLEGKPCKTTQLGGSLLNFKVPLVEGGRHDLLIRHRRKYLSSIQLLESPDPGQLSNTVQLQVLPKIDEIDPVRIEPGTMAKLVGSGFAPGLQVSLNDEEISAYVVSSSELAFEVFRPSQISTNISGEDVKMKVILADGSVSNTINVVLDTYRIVTFGDSIVWGQGLRDAQKFSNLVRAHIERKGSIGVYFDSIDVMAHSGAKIGLKPVPDTKMLAPLPGEIPTSYPTINQQVSLWLSRPANSAAARWVDLILIDGGINDINIREIMNPYPPYPPDPTDPYQSRLSWIQKQVALHCHDAMEELLRRVATNFPNAKIIVTGYYPIVSKETTSQTSFNDFVSMMTGISNIREWMLTSIVDNFYTFATESTQQLQRAVDDVNSYIRGPARIFLAVPPFGPRNAVMASDPWLFGPGFGLKNNRPSLLPQDPIAAGRESDCETVSKMQPPRDDVSDDVCLIASVGHPNAMGAQAYFDAIKQFL